MIRKLLRQPITKMTKIFLFSLRISSFVYMSSSPFFTSGLAMWSPAVVVNPRPQPTSTLTAPDTLTAPTDPSAFDMHQQHASFYHQPLYEPRICVLCGLPHKAPDANGVKSLNECDSDVLSYLFHDHSTVSDVSPEHLSDMTDTTKPDRVIYVRTPSFRKRSWWKACLVYIRLLFQKILYHKQHVHPSKRQ